MIPRAPRFGWAQRMEAAVRELNKQINADIFGDVARAPLPPPVPWYREPWWSMRARWTAARERLGEIIAGRRFDDGGDW